MRIRRWLRPVAIGMLVGLVSVSFAACGDDDEPNETASPTATEPEEEEVDGEPTVTIDMQDYAFDVSGDLAEGGSIEFTNTGDEYHMTAFAKMQEGKTIDDVTELLEEQFAEGGPAEGEGGGAEEGGAEEGETGRAAQATSTTARRGSQATSTTAAGAGEAGEEADEEEGEDPFAEVLEEIGLPGSVYSPGTTATVNADMLEPGNYALMCFITTEGGGAPHIVEGMVGELKIGGGEADEAPTPAATYKIDQAGKVTGPATLGAGEHTIALEVGPDAEEQEFALLSPSGNATFATMYKGVVDLLGTEAELAVGATAKIGADTAVLLADFEDTELMYITMDFEPGTYYLASTDTDDESETAPTPLRITVSAASGANTTSGGRAGTTGSSTTLGRGTSTTVAGRTTTTAD